MTFNEDRSRVRSGNAPQNFAVLRHIALDLLRQDPTKGSIRTKRFRAALDEQYLRKVLQTKNAITLPWNPLDAIALGRSPVPLDTDDNRLR